MRKPIDTICLNIAGFDIKINFHPAKNKYFSKKLISDINNEYQGFITRQLLPKPDHSIEIFDNQHHGIYIKKTADKDMRFIHLSEEKTHQTYTYYYVGISLFSHVVTAVLEKLLSSNAGFILHSSAINFYNQAVLFVGHSSAGKSTAITLLKDIYTPLADDTVILRKKGAKFYLYQTPFVEKNDWVKKRKGKYKIQRVCFLKKTPFYGFEKIIDKNYLTSHLLKQLVINKEVLKKQIKYFTEFIDRFNDFYFLNFSLDKEKMLDLFRKIEVKQMRN